MLRECVEDNRKDRSKDRGEGDARRQCVKDAEVMKEKKRR